MYKSFGRAILDFLKPGRLTIPVLARALGMHLGEFETAMAETKMRPVDQANLAKLLSQGNLRQVWNLGNIPESEVLGWFSNWQQADPSLRTADFGESDVTWDDVTMTLVAKPLPNYELSSVKDWLAEHPIFTSSTICTAFGHNIYDEKFRHRREIGRIQELFLRPLRWVQHVELGQRIWRWDPLGLRRKPGRATIRPFSNQNQFEPEKLLQDIRLIPLDTRLKRIARELLVRQRYEVRLKEVALSFFGHEENSGNKLQQLRDRMARLGWIYNDSSKSWKVPGV